MGQHATATIIDNNAEFLQGRGFNITSQFGEDGFIAAALKHIGITNRWCFEVGAGDGKWLSNTWSLRQSGWTSVLIESDAERYIKAVSDFTSPNTYLVHEAIGPDSLDRILEGLGAPIDLDFGSLDIDGQDYYCWQGMTKYKPRLMLVEFSPYGPNPENFIPPLGGEGQAGINAIIDLGQSKGYIPLLATAVNVLFAREDAWLQS